MGKTVGQLLREISAYEIAEWQAYDKVEPFGEYRADLRSAIIACTFANAWRGKKQKAFEIDDFIPKFGPVEKQSAEDIKKTLMGFGKGR